MKVNPFVGTFLTALLLLSTSCTKDVADESAEANLSSTFITGSANADRAKPTSVTEAKMMETALLKAVKQATSRFHSTQQAIKEGYMPDNHCVSVPGLGGMGYHWVNPALVDNVFDPLKPEVILYAKGHNGNLRLVAVEYIVLNTEQNAPMFGDQAFNVGGTPVQAPHWSLHVWLYEHNPSGMFIPFNPNISCQ